MTVVVSAKMVVWSVAGGATTTKTNPYVITSSLLRYANLLPQLKRTAAPTQFSVTIFWSIRAQNGTQEGIIPNAAGIVCQLRIHPRSKDRSVHDLGNGYRFDAG